MPFTLLKKKGGLVKCLKALVLLEGKDLIEQSNTIAVLTATKH